MIYIVYITLIALYLCCILSATVVEILVYIFIQEQYDNWKRKKNWQKQEKEREEFMQRLRKRELHKEERRKYPLFYWRELTDGDS